MVTSLSWRCGGGSAVPDDASDDEVEVELIPVGTTCDGCGSPIVEGQHYLRLAVVFDTAGMDSARIFDIPPALAGRKDELFTDVFGR